MNKYYTDFFDYEDIKGNFLIFTKLTKTHLSFVINLEGKQIHNLEVKDSKTDKISLLNVTLKEMAKDKK